MALHQGGREVPQEGQVLREHLHHQVLGESIGLEDVSEMLKFGCCGGGVTDLVSSVLHTP